MTRWRCWCLFLGLSLGAAAGCTSKNPAATCSQGTCIDPNYPYCDLDGSIGGEPGTCIAVTCTAGEFGKCSGNAALTCNQFGTGYDQVSCAHGCDAEQGGCRLCEPNQTACTNGTVATCDAEGNQTISEQCPLGCFEDQPRCRDIDPSNHLAGYFDMSPAPPDLDLTTGQWSLELDTGLLYESHGGSPPTLDSLVVPSGPNTPPMRVIRVGKLALGELYIHSSAQSMSVVFLAKGAVTIEGPVTLTSQTGGVVDPSCSGQRGGSGYAINNAVGATAPGGGGGVSAGGSGGIFYETETAPHPSGGAPHGTDDLQPLVGGCSGGGFLKYGTELEPGAEGGGAIQVSSRKSIKVEGSIIADGVSGTAYASGPGDISISGAGAGGGILLEAPSVDLAANSTLSAKGGDGWGCDPPNEFCSRGGKGGTSTTSPMNGEDVYWVTAAGSNAEFDAGGGGGSVGRIRINTPTNSFTKDSNSVQNALVISGALKTR